MQVSQRAPRDVPASRAQPAIVPKPETPAPGWLSRLLGAFGSKPAEPVAAADNPSALLAFPSEVAPQLPQSIPAAPAARTLATVPSALGRKLVAGALLVGVALGLTLAVRRFGLPRLSTPPVQTGKLAIETRPGNLEILVDGQSRGATPLILDLPPGSHTVTVRGATEDRVVPVTIAAGAEINQYFEMKVAEPVIVTGRVSVVTDPPGARVAVDGKPRGVSPILVEELTTDKHTITVTSPTGSAERTVTVAAGATASVMFSLPKLSGPVGGWLAVSAPFSVEVAEHDDVIGTSDSSRIMLQAGRHEIVLANRSVGYEETRSVDVTAGKTVNLRIAPPKVSVSVNARPWADVTLDGTSLGQTPIANLSVTVGPHELVFRHPSLGERKQTVMVTAKGPNRIAADLTK
jgi:PEGA domain-containing protein